MNKNEYREQIKDYLKKAYNLSDEKVDEVLPRFLTMLAEHLEKMEKISQEQDLPTLCRAGHSLKGALLNLGLQELAAEAYKIEQLDKNRIQYSDRVEMVHTLVEKIKELL